MRARGRSTRLLAMLFAFVAIAPAAHAAKPVRTPAAVDPAIAMYVEHVPSSSGPIAADTRLRQSGTRVEGSSGGTVLLVVALALLTAAFGGTALRRLRAANGKR